MEHKGHLREVGDAFAWQTESFAASGVANSSQLLDALLDAARPEPGQRWLDAACGPGIVARAIAGRGAEVLGLDATAAMVALARDAAVKARVKNASFEVADATDTGLSQASFDGAVTRFSIHHIPIPGRLFDELARIVRPGGRIVVLDHVADEEADARSWAQEIERLRDPSHWASLSPQALTELGKRAGLTMVDERSFGFKLDFDDWLSRGTQDLTAHSLVESGLEIRAAGTPRFTIASEGGRRVLRLQMWLGTWSR